MKLKFALLFIIGIFGLAACNYETIDKYVSATPELPDNPFIYEFGDEVPDFVKGSPQAILTNEKATLGRVLFYDKTLSFNNTTACASCHVQERGFADGTKASEGFIQVGTPRNSMTIVNMFSHKSFFWDGRIDNLKEMVMMPIKNHIEMGISEEDMIVSKVKNRSYYAELFMDAFGSEDINIDRISEALSSFVGSIGSYNTKFDKVQNGVAAYTGLEQQGHELFFKTLDCAACHSLRADGNSNDGFANIGLNIIDADPGREGKFKIPDLRNVALTAPYMHDGSLSSLEDVIEHYSSNIMPNKNLDPTFKQPTYGGTLTAVRGLNLTEQEKKALLAFLNTLTDVSLITDPKFSDPFIPN